MWLVATTTVAGNLPFRLSPGSFVVGRNKSAQIVVADATVSRRHARLVCTPHDLTIEDLGSSNGTFVNDLAVERCSVQTGDCVRFGGVACSLSSSALRFHALDEDESTYAIPKFSDTASLDDLTAAQQQILAHIVEGRCEAEIAAQLGKSPHTVHTHLKAIFQRLGVHSRAELIVKVLKGERLER